jgi:hypothetical protein
MPGKTGFWFRIADPERGARSEGQGRGRAVIREECRERQDRALIPKLL